MSFTVSFALASFGIAFCKSLSSSVFKRTSKKTSFSPASGLTAASFGIDDSQSMDLLRSYFLQVFNLSDSSWKVQMLDHLLSFESTAVPLDKLLSSAMFLLGSSLNLDPDVLAVLHFSGTPSTSPFSRSAQTSEFSVAFYTGFILIWALRVHVPSTSLVTLLPSASASPVVPQSSASPVHFSPSSTTSSNVSSTALSVAAPGPSSTSPSIDSALSLLLSQLSAQVLSLSNQVAFCNNLQSPSLLRLPLSLHLLSPRPPLSQFSSSIPWAPLVKVIPCLPLHPCLTVPSSPSLLVSPSIPFLFPLALSFAPPAPHCRLRTPTFSF